MKNLKIAVGTVSEPKINFLKEVLNKLKIKAEIIAVEVKSGISHQPLSSKETKKGSINRAKRALNKISDADFGIGVEIGYQKNLIKKYEMLCWATIIDKKEGIISCESHHFLLPEFHQAIVKKGKYLGEYVRDYLRISDDKIIQKIGIIIRDRKPFIINALENALIHYLKKNEFFAINGKIKL